MNIIGDCQGEFDAVMALLNQMPDDEVLFLGDMVDRGPKSKEILDWAMKNAKAVLGNHEHMMLDHLQGQATYERDLWWAYNGGIHTLLSYLPNQGMPLEVYVPRAMRAVSPEHITWLNQLPLYFTEGELFVSHASRAKGRTLEQCCELGKGLRYKRDDDLERSILWNRSDPVALDDGKFQVFGHMSHKDVLFYSQKFPKGIGGGFCEDDEPYAVCVDTARVRKVSGIHWPSKKVFSQDYL